MFKTILTFVLTVFLVACGQSQPVLGSEEPTHSYTFEYCYDADALCGVVVYVNEGAYVVSSVHLSAKDADDEPDGATINPACDGISKNMSDDLDVDQSVSFTAPASCGYKIKIEIEAGNGKDKNVYLTPGCIAEMSTDGTTLNNDWSKVKTSTMSDSVTVNDDGTPVDADGYPCGKLKKAKD